MKSRCSDSIYEVTGPNFEKVTKPLIPRWLTHFVFMPLAVLTMAQSQLPAAETDDAPSIQGWIDKAEKSGALTLDFYDPRKPPKPYPGWTDFDFRLKYRYEVKTQWKPASDKTFRVSVVPTFTSIDPSVTHVVRLPQTIDRDEWYQSVLGSHELDHVAIGTHPRLSLLATHLLKSTGTLNRKVNRVSDMTDEWISKLIQEEANPRQQSIYDLILKNNQQLDELTRHGKRPIPDRDLFFERLFLKENLDELRFPYLADSLKLLKSEEYQNAKSIFEKP